MANPVALPGTVVSSGAAVSPGGAQGVTGTPAWTTNTAGFTIPNVGSTVSVTVADASWIVVGEMLYVDQAGGGVGLSGILQVQSKSGNVLTLLNPTPAPAIPPADATQAGLLKQLSGNTTDFVDGTNACQNLVTAVQPTIWSATRRVFNAIGNPTFEIDQINVGNQINVPVGTQSKQCDRWYTSNGLAAGGPNFFGQQVLLNSVVPGTNFLISNRAVTLTFAVQKATLAAGDLARLNQFIEGSSFRELINDVFSLSLLVSTNVVGGLKFSVSIRDPGSTTKSLVKLCTIPTANAPTLIQLPNIPVFPAGNWNYTPGLLGCYLDISVAVGSTYIAPAADTWQSGNFLGAPGMDNFFSKPANSTLTVSFIQLEPGPLCTTPMDCPFSQNLIACQRYFQKSYSYATKPGTTSGDNLGGVYYAQPFVNWGSTTNFIRYSQPMAKVPTVTTYSPVTGASGVIRDVGNGADRTVTSIQHPLDCGYSGVGISGQATTGNPYYSWDWIADTGW